MNSKNIGMQPNFTSTFVPSNAKLNVLKASDKLSKYFEVKGFVGLTPDKVREEIKLSQVGINWSKEGFWAVGKDREADEFVARVLRNDELLANYTQDTPVTKFEGQIFDFTA